MCYCVPSWIHQEGLHTPRDRYVSRTHSAVVNNRVVWYRCDVGRWGMWVSCQEVDRQRFWNRGYDSYVCARLVQCIDSSWYLIMWLLYPLATRVWPSTRLVSACLGTSRLVSACLGTSQLDSCFGRIVMCECMCSSCGRVVIVTLVADREVSWLKSWCRSRVTCR